MTMMSTGSKPGIICCQPTPDRGLVEASVVVSGSLTVAQLESLRRHVIEREGFNNNEYDVTAALSEISGKPVLVITVTCYVEGMTHEAQIERVCAFMRALSPFVEVKGLDMSQLAAQPTMH